MGQSGVQIQCLGPPDAPLSIIGKLAKFSLSSAAHSKKNSYQQTSIVLLLWQVGLIAKVKLYFFFVRQQQVFLNILG